MLVLLVRRTSAAAFKALVAWRVQCQITLHPSDAR